MRFPSIDDYDAANAVNVDCWFAEWIGWLSMQVVCSQAWTGNAVTPQLQQPAGWTLDRIVETVALYHCTTVPLYHYQVSRDPLDVEAGQGGHWTLGKRVEQQVMDTLPMTSGHSATSFSTSFSTSLSTTATNTIISTKTYNK